MFTTLMIIAIVAAILLILVVLVQNPKGGGIAANFSAANQIAGVKKTNEFVEKATWTLALVLVLAAVGSRFVYAPDTAKQNEFLERIENSTPLAPGVVAPSQDAGNPTNNAEAKEMLEGADVEVEVAP
jgi:preprotein translocase subunit SecG